MKIIDAHLHFWPEEDGFTNLALAAGHENNAEHLEKAYEELGIVCGIVMGNRSVDPEDHRLSLIHIYPGLRLRTKTILNDRFVSLSILLPVSLQFGQKPMSVIQNGSVESVPCSKPVSYTHLDVYKRQSWNSASVGYTHYSNNGWKCSRTADGCSKRICGCGFRKQYQP